MKIINGKGKIFNTINVFDLLIMCLFVSVLFCVYFGVKYPRTASRIVTGKVHYRPMSIKIVLGQEMEWMYDSIAVGDIQKGRFDKKMAEITKKGWENLGDKKYAVVEFSIQAQSELNGVLTYEGKMLKPGESFIFESDKLKLSGFVKEIKGF